MVLYKCIVGLFSHPFLSQAQMLGSCNEETILASIHSAQGRVAWPAGLHVEPALRELVEGLLCMAPGARWGLEQVVCCSAFDVAAARAVAARGGFEEEMDGLLVRPRHATPRRTHGGPHVWEMHMCMHAHAPQSAVVQPLPHAKNARLMVWLVCLGQTLLWHAWQPAC